ncbi:hypothetical protein BXZ70DRAFT_12210 [Cristinia sonorae]|uniref:CCHC-type domain-containing protein n=1 Tax=Cristinia sonorae TaxID=1940300 RepID=A0A8K0UZJ3_9AGAR|nr:hypothetical protein BXZ70DRAFT_12210 [Cristinia sonorae]
MTRYTDIARKRTYVQAGFQDDSYSTHQSKGGQSNSNNIAPLIGIKRRKWGEKQESSGGGLEIGDENGERGGRKEEETATNSSPTKAEKGKRKLSEKKRGKDAEARKFASERRREKRKDQRHADTTCFACREKGHAAKDCPKSPPSGEDAEGSGSAKRKQNKTVVGICYRCGSRKHNLSKCPKPVDPANPLPFASCFVCSGNGHLAGSCPENKEKGVYPNGGCCKICSQTTHLAKDCDLRKQEVASTKLFVGTGEQVGADEDDFHSFKRRTAEVSKEEKGEDKVKKMQVVKRGVHSGVVKAFGQVPPAKPRKVVTF